MTGWESKLTVQIGNEILCTHTVPHIWFAIRVFSSTDTRPDTDSSVCYLISGYIVIGRYVI